MTSGMDPGDRAQLALDDLEREVLLATQLIAELRNENAALHQQLEMAAGKAGAAGSLAPPQGWDEERRRWTTERQAIADRLKMILGKFQWLEGGAT